MMNENDPFRDAHIAEIENEKKQNKYDALNCLKNLKKEK